MTMMIGMTMMIKHGKEADLLLLPQWVLAGAQAGAATMCRFWRFKFFALKKINFFLDTIIS